MPERAPSPAPGSARRILITGGAGFIGGNVAVELAQRHPSWELTAFDSLRRRGSELNLPRLREAGVRFVHGDVREPADLAEAGPFDALLECSAEPSVMAGVDGATDFIVRTNLMGAYNCLEAAARHRAQVVFLSTSRVYPVAALNAIAVSEGATRYEIEPSQTLAGVSERGVAEHFPLAGARTLYGATKLAAELLVAEYADGFGLQTTVDRCGVVAGPWQMGKVDQGVFTHWMASFYFGRPLRYLGFGGAGKQVRDLLHVFDLADLLDDQLQRPEHWAGAVCNVGGGAQVSLSLLETTALCRDITGRELTVGADASTRAGDVRVYVSDCTALTAFTEWAPRRGAPEIMGDIFTWIRDNERMLAATLSGAA